MRDGSFTHFDSDFHRSPSISCSPFPESFEHLILCQAMAFHHTSRLVNCLLPCLPNTSSLDYHINVMTIINHHIVIMNSYLAFGVVEQKWVFWHSTSRLVYQWVQKTLNSISIFCISIQAFQDTRAWSCIQWFLCVEKNGLLVIFISKYTDFLYI